MSSRHASRRRRQRHQRQLLKRARHQSAPVTVPVLVGFGRLVATSVPWHPDIIPQPVSMSGTGSLRGKIHRRPDLTRHAPLADGPFVLVRWRSAPPYQMIEPVRRFATEELAYAAAAGLIDSEKFTVVRTDQTAEKRLLDDERPALVDDDDDDDDLVDDEHLVDEPPPKRSPKTGKRQPASHPWKGDVSAATRADAEYFSDLRSKIPPTRIAGSGVLAAVAVADRQLAQI
jgi:hypothetical protein